MKQYIFNQTKINKMKQFNKCYKSVIAIVLLFCCVNAFAQPSSYYNSNYVRNWRVHKQAISSLGANTFFNIGSNVYTVFSDTAIYVNNQYQGVQHLSNLWQFNTTTETWAKKNTCPAAGRSYAASFVIDNAAYVGLGHNYENAIQKEVLSDTAFYKYDAVNDVWSAIAPYPDDAISLTLSFSLNGKGYVVGGDNREVGSGFYRSHKTFEYNPATNTWQQADSFPMNNYLISNFYKVFTNNNKAYLLKMDKNGNELWQFDPAAAAGSQWSQKTAPAFNTNLPDAGLFEISQGCLLMGGALEYLDINNQTVNADNDTVYRYDASNDIWTSQATKNKFHSNRFSATINNEAYYYSDATYSNVEIGYDYTEPIQYSFYYTNAFISSPLDTVYVTHNFKSVCEGSSPTISYNVSNPLNANNQFIFAITRNDGLVLDTLTTVAGNTGGSLQITIPTAATLLAKAQQIGAYNLDLSNLKLAVLTTSPRTIFANQSKSFSLVNDPSLLNAYVYPINSNECPGSPLILHFDRLESYTNNTSFVIKKGLSLLWSNGVGVDIPTNDSTIDLVATDSFANNISADLEIRYNVFCHNVDTTYIFTPPIFANRYTNNYIGAFASVQEGNSVCNGGNQTKHIITNFFQESVDSSLGLIELFKNGTKIYADSFQVYRGDYYTPTTQRIDTIAVTGINNLDSVEVRFRFQQGDRCNPNSPGEIKRKIYFYNYQNALSQNKLLEYKFSNNLIDSSSTHNNALGSNISFTTDRFGRPNSALRIYRDTTATNVSQVLSDTNINISDNSQRTVSFWFKTDSVGYHLDESVASLSRPAILGWGSLGNYSQANFIHIEPATKKVVFRGTYNDVYTENNVFKFNEWTHVAFVYDSIYGSLYLNGKCVLNKIFYTSIVTQVQSLSGLSFTYYPGNNAYLQTQVTPLIIGNDGTGVNLNSDWAAPFDGSVDDILIYNKAMTACQIDSLFKRVETGGCTPTSSTINVSVCSNQLPYMFRGKLYNTAGSHKDTINNVAGCDSVITLNLTVKQTSIKSIDTSICAGSAYFFKGINRTTAGTYKDTLHNVSGCDSIITLNLSIEQISTKSIDTSICAGSTYFFKGINRTTTGTYKDTLHNVAGCDSFVTLHLTIKQKSATIINGGVCAGDAYTFNGNNLTTAGTYHNILVNAAGCDSIVTLNLKINVATDTTLYRAICAGSSITIFGETYTTAGTHHITKTNAADCDSNITLIVTVNQSTSSLKRDTICSTQLPYLWNGINRTTADTFTQTFANATGCDSIATLILTVKQPTSSTTTDSIYAGNSYIFSGNTYTTAGTRTVHLINSVGCDSAATLILIVKPSIAATITGSLVGCSFITTNTLRASVAGGFWRSSNQSVAKINEFGVVTAISNGTTTITYTYYKNGQPIVSSVTYTVAVLPSLNPTTGPTIVCAGSSITLTNNSTIPNGGNGVWITGQTSNASVAASTGVVAAANAGNIIVKYTVTSAFGCTNNTDYSVKINAIPTVPSIVYAPGTTSNPQAGAPTGSFCVGRVFGVAGVPAGGSWGATGAASTTINGIVTINSVGAGSIKYTYTDPNGCSNSRTMSGNGYTCAARSVSMNNEQLAINNDFTMYPNPTKSLVNILVDKAVGEGSISVTDLLGKQLKKQSLSMGINTINVNSLSKGVYLISLITNNGKSTKKLVVE